MSAALVSSSALIFKVILFDFVMPRGQVSTLRCGSEQLPYELKQSGVKYPWAFQEGSY